MLRLTACLTLALLMAIPSVGARAQTDGQAAPSPTERLQEGAAAIIDGLRMLMDQLQSYQPPEVMPNGDIIIRRQPPAAPPASPPAPADPGTDTAKPQSL